MTLTEQLEQCFYYNARCIGTCVFVGLINDQDKWYPEQFCDFLFQSSSMLADHLAKLLDTKSGRKATWLYPNDFRQVFEQEPSNDYRQYIVDVGKYAFFKEAGGIGSYDRYPKAFRRTTDMAINACLSLLKVATENNASDITSLMLDDLGYLQGIASHHLLMQLFLRRMHRPNDYVFVPDKYLDTKDSSSHTSLRFFDQPIDESSEIIYVPDQLSPIWIQGTGRPIATGHLEFMGMRGTICDVNDPYVPKLFDELVIAFVRGISY